MLFSSNRPQISVFHKSDPLLTAFVALSPPSTAATIISVRASSRSANMPRQSRSAIDDQTFFHHRRVLWLGRDEREMIGAPPRKPWKQRQRDQRREVRYAVERCNTDNEAAEEELFHLMSKQYLELLHKRRMLEVERDDEREILALRRQQLALEKDVEIYKATELEHAGVENPFDDQASSSAFVSFTAFRRVKSNV